MSKSDDEQRSRPRTEGEPRGRPSNDTNNLLYYGSDSLNNSSAMMQQLLQQQQLQQQQAWLQHQMQQQQRLFPNSMMGQNAFAVNPFLKMAWRKGKWFNEEEVFTKKLIDAFNNGYLKIPSGTTLRSFLSEKLGCDPMRITKKFAGSSCIGKQVYSPCDLNTVDKKLLKSVQEELEKLEKAFREKIELGGLYVGDSFATNPSSQMPPLPGSYHDAATALDFYQNAMATHQIQQAMAAAQVQNQNAQYLQQQALAVAMAAGMHPQGFPAVPYPFGISSPYGAAPVDSQNGGSIPMAFFADAYQKNLMAAASSSGSGITEEQRSTNHVGDAHKHIDSKKSHDEEKASNRSQTISNQKHRKASKEPSGVKDKRRNGSVASTEALTEEDSAINNAPQKDNGSKLLMNFYKAAKMKTEKDKSEVSNTVQSSDKSQQQQSTGQRTAQSSSSGSDGTTSMPSDPSDPSEGSNENYSASERAYSASSLSDSDKSDEKSEDNNPQDAQTDTETKKEQSSSGPNKNENYCTLESLQYNDASGEANGPPSLAASRKRYIEHHRLDHQEDPNNTAKKAKTIT